MRIKSTTALITMLLALLISHSSAVNAFDVAVSNQRIGLNNDLHTRKWNHGSKDCDSSTEPGIEVAKIDPRSFVLRQSKCSHYEAPFMYLLLGQEKALLFDTGAIADADQFPIHQAVVGILSEATKSNKLDLQETLVIHSHHHQDHYAGDQQFVGNQRFNLIAPDLAAVNAAFGSSDSGNEPITIDLGERKLKLIPIPGHQEDSVALFDQHTGWLLTGDTLYPGSIRVNDWQEFRKSIKRLTEFSKHHEVTGILGGHIEMRTDKNKIYRIGSTFQPKERPLALTVDDLNQLAQKLEKTNKATTLQFDKFVIDPLNYFELKLQKFMTARAQKSAIK